MSLSRKPLFIIAFCFVAVSAACVEVNNWHGFAAWGMWGLFWTIQSIRPEPRP
jgi:hypothetical protein